MSSIVALHVVKRNGSPQSVMFDKITSRVSKLCYGLDMDFVDPATITMKVVGGLFPGISTSDLDSLAAETAATMYIQHPDYATLASRIAISNLHKQTKKSFSAVIDTIFNTFMDNGRLKIISERLHSIVMKNADRLNSCIMHDNDFLFSYMGFKTLENSCLITINERVVERPQHMFLRIAIGIHFEDVDSAIETYNLLSEHWFIHATSTLYNAGKFEPQLSSSYVLSMQEDSIVGIYDTLSHCAKIMKDSGGIGLNIHCIRSKGSEIVGTNGESTGIVPMLRVYNSSIKYSNSVCNKRIGAMCIYLEPWHLDIFEFVELRKNYGAEELRAKDLSYALWIPDLFMERVESDKSWTLMCPRDCPDLENTYGDEFKILYERYEAEGKGRKVIKAQQLWYMIVESQIETGNPMITYKDACNRKSNQKNVGIIKSSSLFGEVMQYSSPTEAGSCSLASIALSKFVQGDDPPAFDFQQLLKVTAVIVKNLNKIIDINKYSIDEAEKCTLRHRPIGIGVQGLADAFALMKYSFDCEDARRLNRDIFEAIYYAALQQSCELAKIDGSYETFEGSPLSEGIFQFNMWNVTPSSRWDWNTLKQDIMTFGVRNSILIAVTPTSLTSKFLGNNRSISPFVSNLFSGQLRSEDFHVINVHLLRDLMKMGCWNEDIKKGIIAAEGSIQSITAIPDKLKNMYRTAWEIPQRAIIDMTADRAPFIDQSQSLTIYLKDPTYAKITSMHFYGWKKGLKTGMHCLKTKSTFESNKPTLSRQIREGLKL